ncbi:DNA recombination protein RmuC [Proteocatella sphenisci]|uniref:DNA recombination protein RmuC n=1 Tax=Proteocatella sphenisci TaxID=181070 RepID=UPI0004B04072|nr:DNA recombination protein RmuC [Proteocatella sphenisci]
MNWTYTILTSITVLNAILLIVLINKIGGLSSADSLSELFNKERENQHQFFAEEFRNNRIEMNQEIRASIDSQNKIISSNTIETEKKLDAIRLSIENRLSSIQRENTVQLEKIRETVDEKLQKTLESRISESFKMVSERLEQVYKGLGEMQTLAIGVGDLKKVLSNVKSRGVLGEIQLGAILEEILTKEQYESNVITKKGSQNFVEYAIKLPGDSNPVYLPIDAKFPADAYSKLIDAYEAGEASEVEISKNILIKRLKSFAKDIHDKYIDPPNTTEFAIMFLPFEGLYAEAVRLGMVEELQRLYKVNIAGPTTTAALLNSLQMGFKTLAIQKRSGEVWDVLGAVKTEFNKFASVLESAQSRIEQANTELDKLIGVRTRQIKRKLKDVEAIENSEAFIGEEAE